MLGSDVAAAGRRAGHDVVALTRAELDVTRPDHAAVRLAEHRPDAVVNCAAWTDVDGAEAEEARALEANAPAAFFVRVADAGAVLLHVSTDYVFDGAKRTPYVEGDRPAPQGAYGRTKLAGEETARASGGPHLVVRSGWLYGTGGDNFVDTMLRLGRERGHVTVVDDQLGCPTSTRDLADGLVELLEREARGLWHLAAEGECTWFTLAREALLRAGIPCTVEPTTTAALGRPAPRPDYSVLRSERGARPLPHWREGVARYLAERASVVTA